MPPGKLASRGLPLHELFLAFVYVLFLWKFSAVNKIYFHSNYLFFIIHNNLFILNFSIIYFPLLIFLLFLRDI